MNTLILIDATLASTLLILSVWFIHYLGTANALYTVYYNPFQQALVRVLGDYLRPTMLGVVGFLSIAFTLCCFIATAGVILIMGIVFTVLYPWWFRKTARKEAENYLDRAISLHRTHSL